MTRKKIFSFVFILAASFISAQSVWKDNALLFIQKYGDTDYNNFGSGQLDSAIVTSTQFIGSVPDSTVKETLAEIYSIRAGLQLQKLRNKINEYNNTLDPNDDTYSRIESDYIKAMNLCMTCKCKYLQEIKTLYLLQNNDAKLNLADKQIHDLGGDTEWPSYIGIGLNYVAPNNIIGAELNYMGFSRIFPRKIRNPDTGKKFRACDYQYPVALGFPGIGYELSANNTNYSAFKISPVWFNYIVALNPAQFLYARYDHTYSVVWRPEIGVSYSGLSFNYSFNLPFNKSFNYLPHHMFSVKIIIPTIKVQD